MYLLYKYSENQSFNGNIMSNMKIPFVFFYVFLITQFLFATAFDQGKEFFLNNKPVEAAIYFEKAMSEDQENENIYMYLGLSYIQSGLTDKGISSFLKGADLEGAQRGRFYMNAGNAYFSMNDYENALAVYELIIEEGLSEKGKALLNSANILMHKEELSEAVSQYKLYLVEEPLSDQRDKILRLISLIETKIEADAREMERLAAEAERLRLEEEQRKATEAAEVEKLRLAEEKRKAEEAARQQALMNEILNSLSKIKDETQNIAADSETIIITNEDSDIDD